MYLSAIQKETERKEGARWHNGWCSWLIPAAGTTCLVVEILMDSFNLGFKVNSCFSLPRSTLWVITLLFSDCGRRSWLSETTWQCMSGRTPCGRGAGAGAVWGGERWAGGMLSVPMGCWGGVPTSQHSLLVLQDLPFVCRLVGEAKIVLGIKSWILEPLCLIDCSVSLVIVLQLQATEAFWLKSSWFKGENPG